MSGSRAKRVKRVSIGGWRAALRIALTSGIAGATTTLAVQSHGSKAIVSPVAVSGANACAPGTTESTVSDNARADLQALRTTPAVSGLSPARQAIVSRDIRRATRDADALAAFPSGGRASSIRVSVAAQADGARIGLTTPMLTRASGGVTRRVDIVTLHVNGYACGQS